MSDVFIIGAGLQCPVWIPYGRYADAEVEEFQLW